LMRGRHLFGDFTTPRDFKHGARDLPFGMGALSVYVDAINGHDSNDGESWKTAVATIQEAVDIAEPWTQIFIKSGTYAESVVVDTENISLIGADKATTVLSGTEYTLLISSNHCSIQSLQSKVNTANYSAVRITGDDCIIKDCVVDATPALAGTIGVIFVGDHAEISNVSVSSDITYIGLTLQGDYLKVHDCEVYGCTHGLDLSGNYGTICDNTVMSCTRGISVLLGVATGNAVIYHNNLINNTTQAQTDTPQSIWIENFYSDHTNINNGFGIATKPYPFTNDIDLSPVVTVNGWNLVSLQRSLLRKKTAAQASQAATDANGIDWVDLKTIAPTISDIELYRLKLTTAGSWAGTAKYRIIVGTTKVYPFPADKDISTGVLESFIFPINIQINETAKIQFRSDNAADGAGETVALTELDYATVL